MSQLAILYTRTSTDRQELSTAVQGVKNAGYCSQAGLITISELVFDDADVTGRMPFWERPQGRIATGILNARTWLIPESLSPESARRLAAAGFPTAPGSSVPVETIVFSKVDRMGRRAKHQLDLLEWIESKGLKLHIVDFFGDTFCNQTPMGKLVGKVMFGMLALFAELEVETIRSRITDAFVEKRARRELCGLPAYGEAAVPSGRFNKQGREIMLSGPHPEELAWLQAMLAWRAQGWSYGRIAENLTQMGVPTKLGRAAWSHGSVAHALTSRYATTLASTAPNEPDLDPGNPQPLNETELPCAHEE